MEVGLAHRYAPLWAYVFARAVARRQFRPAPSRRRAGGETSRTEDCVAPKAGRGRSADTPSEIPPQGGKDILLGVYHGISEDCILLVAAGVIFYLLLSIFPGIAPLAAEITPAWGTTSEMQREAAFFWHKHGTSEEGCPIVRAP